MNRTLSAYARKMILEGLSKLPESNNYLFKMMYGRLGGKRSVEDASAKPIEEVVNEMPDTKLDWALSQVENSLANIKQ